ncbi:MAG: hypothetical protein KDB74_10820, partial [Flavobacteriales bacterium]|nr:hypothetical protein [Flavobacteriales bacterium]
MNKSSISWLLILMVVLSYLLISLTDTQNPTNKTLNIPISKYFPEIPKKNQIQINQKEVKIGRYLFYDHI